MLKTDCQETHAETIARLAAKLLTIVPRERVIQMFADVPPVYSVVNVPQLNNNAESAHETECSQTCEKMSRFG